MFSGEIGSFSSEILRREKLTMDGLVERNLIHLKFEKKLLSEMIGP